MHTHIYMCISIYIYRERESVYSCLAFTNPYTYKPEGFHRFLHQVHLHLGLFFGVGVTPGAHRMFVALMSPGLLLTDA